MLETYVIDQSLLGNIKKKMIVRGSLLIGIPLILTFIPDFFTNKKIDLKSTAIAFGFVTIALVFSITKALKNQISSYKTLKIILDDDGIERKAEMQPYKKIEWTNLQFEENSKGIVDLYDKNVSKFSRKMYGRGWIRIQPEIINYEILLNSIRSKVASSN